MQGDEGCVINLLRIKLIFNTCDSDSKVWLARGPSALVTGDMFYEDAGVRRPGKL